MLVRVLRARVPTERAGTFNALIRGKLDHLKGQPGLEYAKLARRFEDGIEEVILFEEWRTPEALQRWAGGHLTEARFLPGMEQLVTELSITHYEALDIDPAELDLRVFGPAAGEPKGTSD